MRLDRYECFKTNEEMNNSFSAIGDAFLTDDQGFYKLDVFPDTSCFRLYFPDGGFAGYENSTLNLPDNENPFADYEEGKLLTWMRNVVFPERNNYDPGWRENRPDLSKPEGLYREVIMKQFEYMPDDGAAVHFEISSGGLVSIRIPERSLSGSIDQIRDAIPEIGFLWNGALLRTVKKEFHNVTGINLGE